MKEGTEYGVRLYLKPKARGTPVVQARLGSTNGPVIAEQEIDEFTVDSSAAMHVVVNGSTGIGNTELKMKPWIPDINVNCAMFANFSTFPGGATTYSINTSDSGSVNINGDPAVELVVDPTTGETQAVLRVDFEIPPDEDSYCFEAIFDQHSKYGTKVGCKVNNGLRCGFEPDPRTIYICEGCPHEHTLSFTEDADNNTTHARPSYAGHTHAMSPWPADAAKFNITAGSTYNCLNTGPDRWDAKVTLTDKAKAGDKLSVVICGTKFADVITIISVDIKAEDGTSDPREYVDADTDVAASYNTVKYKAVITPAIAGTYTWSTTSTKISLVNANGQTVTVNAGANASTAVDAEDLKVEFTPTGSTTTCDDTHDLTVVHCTFTAYADNVGPIGHGWWQHGITPADAVALVQPADIQAWANIPVGYFPIEEPDPPSFEAQGIVLSGPGSQGHTPTSQHTWDVPFILLDNGLTYSKTLDASPGIYNLFGNNCCHKVIQAGGACSVSIPNDKTDPDKLHDYLSGL